jgi:acyl carrier protein
MQETLKELNKIFIDVLNDDKILLSAETTARDVEDWDSLTHIQLIVAIEKHFKIRFASSEIRLWKNVGQMCEAIQKRVNS